MERLELLREEMNKHNIYAYIIPTGDYHDTEYVCEHFACRKYISGFTGSAGTLVVLKDKAALWTDGRYFIQAAEQLKDTGIDLMKISQPETISLEKYITDSLKEGESVGFDGKVVTTKDYRQWLKTFDFHHLKVVNDVDLVNEIWSDRPSLPSTNTFHYDEKYAGYAIDKKLEMVREKMEELHARSMVITRLDEIAWLFNLRAKDIPCFPVALAYAVVTLNGGSIYIDDSRLDDVSSDLFEKNNIDTLPYNQIYEDVKRLPTPVLYDPSTVNSLLGSLIPAPSVEEVSPIILMKACKNEVELKNTKNAHLKDAVAVTRFIYWLKRNVGLQTITEVSAQEKLMAYRRRQQLYIEDSFDTICAYKEHAALMHYKADPNKETELEKEGMLLVDSGGQYMDGTTDITRTIVLGPISKEERKWFTLALRGHIRLAKATWLYGCRGVNLDILARGPLWDENMDYQCGTGHGVGHLSSVHEAPNGFRWRIVPERNDNCILEEGMIQSNEPGVYVEGEFGIRHENEYVVVKGEKNFYGQFMHMECLTYVPFDRDGIDTSLLTKDELKWINDYHKEVFDRISPYMGVDEYKWLKEVCHPIII